MSSDILQNFAECLHSAGLAVEAVQADGLLHRCGTLDKPRKLDGAYKAFLDEPPSIWWKNWRTGDEGTWTAVKEKDWTAKQRKQLKARIEAIKKESRIAQEQRWEAAAKLAIFIWRHSRPVDNGHSYLTRKKVQSFGLRQTQDGKLVVPVLDKSGHIQSLQFIFPEKQNNTPDKLFLKGGRTARGHFLIKSGEEDHEPLLIAEGYATAASLHMATGYPVMMAFSAGNLESVGKLARESFPDREIIVCADNDIATKDNPGVLKAKETAGRIGAKLAICPVHNGKSTDFNDLHCSLSLEDVRTVIEAARKQIANCPMPDGFSLVTEGKRAGLYRLDVKPDGDICETWLGPPLFIKGMTRDRDGNEWGLMLEWTDPDGNRHSWAMPIELLFR